jgi:hypothetical protein
MIAKPIRLSGGSLPQGYVVVKLDQNSPIGSAAVAIESIHLLSMGGVEVSSI